MEIGKISKKTHDKLVKDSNAVIIELVEFDLKTGKWKTIAEGVRQSMKKYPKGFEEMVLEFIKKQEKFNEKQIEHNNKVDNFIEEQVKINKMNEKIHQQLFEAIHKQNQSIDRLASLVEKTLK